MKVYLAGPITGKSKEAIREDFLGRKDALEAMRSEERRVGKEC